MMKKIYRKAVTTLRWLVIVVALLALAVNGASAAQRLFDAYQAPAEQELSLSENATMAPGAPEPGESPENMTPSSKPNSEAYAYLTVAPLIDFNKNCSRLEHEPIRTGLVPVMRLGRLNRSTIKSTAFLVSSQLGHQFTLVGAKPSGTS
ncbi:MAG: hypothetical protein JSU74_05865 [Candidatus Zixiibacteriota bacterium]|nr:MAG: hypothetical protein JSU74_05865 [candidate division Zixibacteria bacterium]